LSSTPVISRSLLLNDDYHLSAVPLLHSLIHHPLKRVLAKNATAEKMEANTYVRYPRSAPHCYVPPDGEENCIAHCGHGQHD